MQVTNCISDFEHTRNTFRGSLRNRYLYQLSILVLEHLSIFDCQPVLFHFLGSAFDLEVCFLWTSHIGVVHFLLDIGECVLNLYRKRPLIGERLICKAVASVHAARERSLSQHHLRMVIEILVDCNPTVIVFYRICPGGFQEIHARIGGFIRTLFQNQNVRYNFCTGIIFECRAGKSNGTQKIRLTHNVPANRGILAVHGIAGCNEHYNAARANLIQGLGKEVVVNRACDLLRICLVVDGEISERNIANGHVHVVIRDLGIFKSLNANIRIRVQVLCNQAGNPV